MDQPTEDRRNRLEDMRRAMIKETIAMQRDARDKADKRESAVRRLAANRLMRGACTALLTMFCATLTVLTVVGRSPLRASAPVVEPTVALDMTRQALLFGVLKIQAFSRAHGALPTSAAEAGLKPAASWTLQRLGPDRYVLTVKNGGSVAAYDSLSPVENYFRRELRDVRTAR